MRSLLRHQCAYRLASGWPSVELNNAADLAQGYPIELRTSGAMQTLAFSMSKHDAGHRVLARAIASWVLSPESGKPLGDVPEQERDAAHLLKRLASAPRAGYLAAESEAIAFADALKLITQALKASAPVEGTKTKRSS